jgi:hypothetical protein
MKDRINQFVEKYGEPIRESKGWAFYSLLVVIFLLPMGSLLCLFALYIRWKDILFKNEN